MSLPAQPPTRCNDTAQEPTVPDLDPQRLIDALSANGFTIAGHRPGAYVRYREGSQDIIVSTDTNAPEHDLSLASVLADLARRADTGRRAAAVLAAIGNTDKSGTDEGDESTVVAPGAALGPTRRAQSSSPWQAGSLWHAWSAEDSIPDVNQLYADLDHAKACTIDAFLDSEVGSDEDDPAEVEERKRVAARLEWRQRHGNSDWELVYTDKPGMAGWTDVYIGERHVLAKPATAGLDLSAAAGRVTGWAYAGGTPEPAHEDEPAEQAYQLWMGGCAQHRNAHWQWACRHCPASRCAWSTDLGAPEMRAMAEKHVAAMHPAPVRCDAVDCPRCPPAPACVCPPARFDATGQVETLPQGTDPNCRYCHPATTG